METQLEKYKYKIQCNIRAYFDYLSHESKCLNIEDKLLNLALFVNEDGDLHHLIASYRNAKSEIYVSCLKKTLLMLVGYMREGKYITILGPRLEDKITETQLITILSLELKNRLERDFSVKYDVLHPKMKVRIGGYDMYKLIEGKTKEEGIQHLLLGDFYGLDGYHKLVLLNNYRQLYISPGNCTKQGRFDLIHEALSCNKEL